MSEIRALLLIDAVVESTGLAEVLGTEAMASLAEQECVAAGRFEDGHLRKEGAVSEGVRRSDREED